MEKRLSASSARGWLKRLNSDEIRRKQWTEAEGQVLRKVAEAQATGNSDAGVDSSEIPPLTADQLWEMVRHHERRRKVH